MHQTTLDHARLLWTYLSSARSRGNSDVVVVCCSYDLRVCDYACRLIQEGLAPLLVVSGKRGNWTRHLWQDSEAHVFRDRALANGLGAGQILVEDQATNFGENIGYVRRLIPQIRRATFITKPNSVLRVALTIPVQWPRVTAFVDCPNFAFPEDVSNVIGVFGVIHEMVGDIDRILEYPSQGFQVRHTLPPDVRQAWRELIEQGFTLHRLTSPQAQSRQSTGRG